MGRNPLGRSSPRGSDLEQLRCIQVGEAGVAPVYLKRTGAKMKKCTQRAAFSRLPASVNFGLSAGGNYAEQGFPLAFAAQHDWPVWLFERGLVETVVDRRSGSGIADAIGLGEGIGQERVGRLGRDELPRIRAGDGGAVLGVGIEADALRLQPGGDLAGDLAAHLQQLGARLGLPVRLGHLGLTAAGIARIADRAAEDAANRTNPRHATARDYRAMLDAML